MGRQRKLLHANTNLHDRLNEAITGHTKDATRYLSKTHSSLSNNTRTMHNIRRNIRIACEELTELSVECMNVSKRRPHFFTTRVPTAQKGDFSRWEELAGVSKKKDERYRTLLSNTNVKVSSQIVKDIPRTPSFGPATHKVDPQKLTNVLHAYQLHDPLCSYVQGMNTIASFLLSREQDEERVFWLLVQMLGSPKYNLRGFYQTGMPQLHIACYQFDQVLEQRLERVSKHLISARIQAIDFLSSWYLSLFTAIPHLNYTLLSNFVEHYLEVGYTALLSIAIGILALHEQKVLTMKHDEILIFLKRDMWKNREETKGSGVGREVDFNSIIAAASKPNILNPREVDRMEVEYYQHRQLMSTK